MDWKEISRVGRLRPRGLGFLEGQKGGMAVDVEGVGRNWVGKRLEIEIVGKSFGSDEFAMGFGSGEEVGIGF